MGVPAADRFGFTKLLVADLETSATFYKTVFGLQERGRVRSEIADRKIDEIMFEAQTPGGASFVLLHFDGVDSSFYAWVNGHKLGYSEDSRTPAEFDLTGHLKAGANLLVMGGFAHGFERELMLGSATRDVYRANLEIPVLLSH